MENANPTVVAFYVKKRTLFSAIFVSVIIVGVLILNAEQGGPWVTNIFIAPFFYIVIRTWLTYFNRKPQLTITEVGIQIENKPLIQWKAIEHCYFKKNDEENDDALVIKAKGIKRNQAVWLSFLDKSKIEVEEVINHYAAIHGFSTTPPPKKWWQ